jgi:hypothetical protein
LYTRSPSCFDIAMYYYTSQQGLVTDLLFYPLSHSDVGIAFMLIGTTSTYVHDILNNRSNIHIYRFMKPKKWPTSRSEEMLRVLRAHTLQASCDPDTRTKGQGDSPSSSSKVPSSRLSRIHSATTRRRRFGLKKPDDQIVPKLIEI